MTLGEGRLEYVLLTLDTVSQIVFLALKKLYGDAVHKALTIYLMNITTALVNDDDIWNIEDFGRDKKESYDSLS